MKSRTCLSAATVEGITYAACQSLACIMILCVLLPFIVVLICMAENIHKCAEFYDHDNYIITNLHQNGSKPTTVNQTCNYEIVAPLGQQVEFVFDVSFNFPVNCVPTTKPTQGIFISYTHYDNVTYYDVICNNKSSYLVRSVGRRLYLKFVMSGVSFSYRGTYYYVQPSDCIHYTCLNGGTCLTTNGKRFCICQSGFSGLACSECSNFTCYNGGSCVLSIDQRISCVCDIHFGGTHCEKSTNPCLSNPCHFGRCDIITSVDTKRAQNTFVLSYHKAKQSTTSIDKTTLTLTKHTVNDQINTISQERSINAWRCACYAGYTGVQCENNINECESSPCLQGQECIDGVNQYECSCNHCVFGLCVVDGTNIVCRCFPGFMGDNCSRNVNECDLNPCIHGDCVDFVNGYVCSCYENYTGRNCDVSIRSSLNETIKTNTSICSNRFCKDGECMEQDSVPYCRCSTGFTGTRCDVPLSVLVPNNITFISQKHECFMKKDLENICSCVTSLCQRSLNSSACDAVMILSSLKTICTVDYNISLCLSFYDSNIVFILQNLCIQEQTGTAFSKPVGNATITTFAPEHWNTRLLFSYVLLCKLTNSEEPIRIELLPFGYSRGNSQSVYLYSECIVNTSDTLIVSNCSLSSITIHFNFSKSLIYLKTISFTIRGVETYNSSNTHLEAMVSDEDFKRTMKMSMISKMVSLDNDTLLFNSSYNGEALYSCNRLCDERYCRQKYCEPKLTKHLMNYEPKLEKKTQCHCPDTIKTEGICNITKDITGSEDKRSYLALYIAAAVSVFLIVLIPGSAYFYVKRSKQRGEAKFPDLLCSSSKVWPLHSPHDWPNEMNNSNNLEKPTTVKYAIRPANDNRVVNLDGVETGKTDV